MRNKRLLLFFGCTLFGFLLFTVFLYVTFPFPRLASTLIARLEWESGCKITVREQTLSFPFKLAWENIQILCPQQKPWEVASLQAEILPLPLIWGGEGQAPFRARLAGGEVTGHLSVTRVSNQFDFSLKNQGRQMNLTGIGGRLDWEGDARWSGSTFQKGTGTIAFTLKGARIEAVGGWRSPIGPLSFSNVTGQTSLRDGKLILSQLEAEGNEMDLSGETGHLLLRQPWQRSRVSLTLKVQPKGRLKPLAQAMVSGYTGEGSFTLGVFGSLGRPVLSLNGKTIPL
jgi:type II secretion system protein N